jgi:hypothetical protein
MQSSTISGKANPKASAFMEALNINYEKDGTFKYYCKKLKITHYATRGKYIDIENQWHLLYKDMIVDIQKNNLNIQSYTDLITYLHSKYITVSINKKFRYEYILRELNNYSLMMQEFISNAKQYIIRLKNYANARKCSNMQEVKNELEHFMNRFIVDINENSKNTYETQDWLIISRYVCDFLEYDDGITEQVNLFA